MNRKDFYKELMKDYTFDSAKVRRAAKRSSLRIVSPLSKRRWWHIPSTVAVAAVALTLGLYAFFYDAENSLQIGTFAELSVQERVIRAELTRSGNETATMFLSFNNSLTFSEMVYTLDSISDTDIEVKAVYIMNEDGTVSSLSIPQELDKIKDVDASQIIGAKVSAPGAYRKELSQQQSVAFVEVENDKINDTTFVPLAAIEGAIKEVEEYFHDLESNVEHCVCCDGECVICQDCAGAPCVCVCECGECDDCLVPTCECMECDECLSVTCECMECDECLSVTCDCMECDDCVTEEN
jgi:hypothetical protein